MLVKEVSGGMKCVQNVVDVVNSPSPQRNHKSLENPTD